MEWLNRWFVCGIVVVGGALAFGCSDSGSAGWTPEELCVSVGGSTNATIEVDGVIRAYIVEAPAIAEGESAPLVVNMHGFGSGNNEQQAYMGLEAPSSPWATSGFVRVYPNGLDASWNGGTCCGDSALDGVDDVAVIRAIVTELSAQPCVDEKRVYATGFSNGGFMSYRLACEASDLFAAVAPVAGVLGVDPADCNPGRPVPAMVFNSLEDTTVPYDGGETVGIAPFASVDDSVAHFRTINGCTGEPVATAMGDMTTCYANTDCQDNADVVLCASEDSGHCWPGIECPFEPVPGPAMDISASAMMIEFFNSHRLD